MERADFAKDIARCEDDSSPGKDTCYFPTFVVTGKCQKGLKIVAEAYLHALIGMD